MTRRRRAIATSVASVVATIVVGPWLGSSRSSRDEAGGAIREPLPLAVALPRASASTLRSGLATTQPSKHAISAALQRGFLDAPDLRTVALQAI